MDDVKEPHGILGNGKSLLKRSSEFSVGIQRLYHMVTILLVFCAVYECPHGSSIVRLWKYRFSYSTMQILI